MNANPAQALVSLPYGNSDFRSRSVVRVFSTGEPRAIEYLISRGWKIISPRKTPKGEKPFYAFGFTKASRLADAEVDMVEARRLTIQGQKYDMARHLRIFLRRVLRLLSSLGRGIRSRDQRRQQQPG